jgi:hypothetical protein
MKLSLNHKALLLAALSTIVMDLACGGSYSGSNSTTGSNTSLSAITLQPASSPAIAIAGTVQIAANGAYPVSATTIDYHDVTQSVKWTTSDAAVATVNAGLVTGKGVGSAKITASLNGKTDSTLVVVGQPASITITLKDSSPLSLSVPTREFQSIAAYPDGSILDLTNFVIWSSSASDILTFFPTWDYSHDPGQATLVAVGSSTITATDGAGEMGVLPVTVVP